MIFYKKFRQKICRKRYLKIKQQIFFTLRFCLRLPQQSVSLRSSNWKANIKLRLVTFEGERDRNWFLISDLFVQFKLFCIILAMSTNYKHFHCLISVYWKVLSDDDNNECLWTFDAGPWKGEQAGNSPDEESAFCKAAIRRPANGYNIFQGPVQFQHHLNIG